MIIKVATRKILGIKKKIESPCIKVCKINEQTGFCEGCKRTLEEISEWQKMPDKVKELVLANLKIR